MISTGECWFRALCALCLLGGCRESPPHRDGTAKTTSASAPAISVTAPPSGSAPPIASISGATSAPSPPRMRARKMDQYAVVDESGSWTPQCLIHRKCTTKATPLERCESSKTARPWAEFIAHALDFEDQVVDLSGRLEFSDAFFSTSVQCSKGTCCNKYRVGAELYAEQKALPLEGFGCTGDESRLCCSVLATGQEVIVHGRLVKFTSIPLRWELDDVSICELAK
ncbi:MAG TPA: hypothetical protein VFK05_13980 [Polyangiaceae bacterium]|nr:hypothetical protein [Polyangiaceae bacterium]